MMKTFQATHSVTHTAYWEEEVGGDVDKLAPWKQGNVRERDMTAAEGTDSKN